MDRRLSISSNTPSARGWCPVPLSGLVLEVDQVLYDPSPWQRWLLQLLSRIGLTTHYEAFFRAFEHDYLEAVYRGERDYWEALRSYLLAAGVSRGRVEEVLAAGHGKAHELWDNIRPLPGVAATLAQLSARDVTLAVLSNSAHNGEELTERLQQLGLAARFQIVLSSRDLGCSKPAPECYQAALDALDVPVESVGFVGRCPVELAGAALMGMTTFAVPTGHDLEADYCLDGIEQLLQVVLSPAQRRRAG